MTSNLLIIGGAAGGYILFAIVFFSFVTKMDNEISRKRAQSIFIGLNIVLLCAAMTYAYVHFISDYS